MTNPSLDFNDIDQENDYLSSMTLRDEDINVSIASDSLSVLNSFTEIIGTNKRDFLLGQNSQIVYGLAGRDSLTGSGETSILVGGSDDNTYQALGNSISIVVENNGSNNDRLYTAVGSNNSAAVGLEKATSFFAEIDDRHLYLGDTESDLYVVLIDWQNAKNRLETIGLAEGWLSYANFVERFRDAEGYRGNITWSELATERNFSELGLSTESFDNELDQITDRALELEPPGSGTGRPEPNPEPEPELKIGKFTEVVGTDGFDSLTGSNFEIIYGVGDRDSLVSGTESEAVNILVGGTGRNTYSVLANSTAVIFENGGNDDNVLFTTVRTGRGINRNSDSFVVADVEGRHLYFGDTESEQYVFLVDWQQPDNQIETFYLLNETVSYDTFANSYRDFSGYLGELSWSELTARELIDTESLGFGVDSFDNEINAINARALELEEQNQTIDLFRFRNTTFDTGTYLFVGEAERDFILNDENLRNTFALDGVSQDGTINPAFVASSVEREGLIPFFRLENLAVPGTFVFVSNAEYDFIFDDPIQSQQWKKQGFDPDNEELDVAEFYLYEGSAGSGTEFNRFQNQINGTFLYAAGAEIDVIEDDPNLNSLFSNQGVAFRSLSI